MLDLLNSDERRQRIELNWIQCELEKSQELAGNFVFNQKIDLINSIKIVELVKVSTHPKRILHKCWFSQE